mgnify:CR=1 FL=1
MSKKLKPISPGEMLAEEFLKPLGMSNYRLAEFIQDAADASQHGNGRAAGGE